MPSTFHRTLRSLPICLMMTLSITVNFFPGVEGLVATDSSNSAESSSGSDTHTLNITALLLPSGSSIQLGINGPYQSSNSDTLFLQGSGNNWYPYDPHRMEFISQTGYPANTANSDHIDQLYYEPSSRMVIGLMEDGIKGGVLPYYLNGYQRDDSTTPAWGSSTSHIHRDPAGGLCGAQSGLVLFLTDTTNGGSVAMHAVLASNGSRVWTIDGVTECRCSPESRMCVAVRTDSAGNTVVSGVHDRTGHASWSTPDFQLNGTFEDVVGSYIVLQTETHTHRLNTISGEVRMVAPRNPSGVSHHRRGTNYIYQVGQTVLVYNIPQAALILNTTLGPDQPNSGTSSNGDSGSGQGSGAWYANYEVVAITSTGKVTFFDADSGALLATVTVLTVPQNPPPWGPFLVGADLVVPTSDTGYYVASCATRAVKDASYQAGQFAPNLVYLSSARTLMWSVAELLQFQEIM